MHIPTHVLSGWCLASVLPLNKRERLFCMLAASLPDLDGLGILVSEELYWDYHHYAGHNVFFGLLVSTIFTAFSARKLLAFVAYLACFHLHLVMNFIGSGQGWLIHYFWPADGRGFKTDIGWPLDSWQNRVAFGLLLLATIAIGYWRRITPLELLAPRIDRWLTGNQQGWKTNPHESDESSKMKNVSSS